MPAGRPRMYKDAETMQSRCDLYFSECEEVGRAPTVAGLALALGFVNRQSLLDYEARDDQFSCVVKRARTRIEQHHEERLSGNTPTGSIYWMKTHGGLKETSVLEHSSPDGSMSPKSDGDALAQVMGRLDKLVPKSD